MKFVDDGMAVTKVNMQTAKVAVGRREGGRPVKEKHDMQTQNVFRRVVARAEERGMVVNHKKTQLLCVSDALSYKAAAFIEDRDGLKLSSGGRLKVLGFHFDTRPTCHAHVEAMQKRMRERVWILRHLKFSGFRIKSWKGFRRKL